MKPPGQAHIWDLGSLPPQCIDPSQIKPHPFIWKRETVPIGLLFVTMETVYNIINAVVAEKLGGLEAEEQCGEGDAQ